MRRLTIFLLIWLFPVTAFAQNLCETLPTLTSGEIAERYTRSIVRTGLDCPLTRDDDVYRLYNESLDVPGDEPSALGRLYATRRCLDGIGDWLDYGYCAYDLHRIDIKAAHAEVDALTLDAAAKTRLHGFVDATLARANQLADAWAAKPDGAAIVAAAKEAGAAWDQLYQKEQARFQAAMQVERALAAKEPADPVCAGAVPALSGWLRESEVATLEDARAALRSTLGWYLFHAVVRCELAQHRSGVSTLQLASMPSGPRRLSARAAFSKQGELQGRTTEPASRRFNQTYRGSDDEELARQRAREATSGRVQSVRREGELAVVTFTRQSEPIKVPYNCRDTDRISRVTRNGSVFYGVSCQYRTERVDATPAPVKISAQLTAGLVPGALLHYAPLDPPGHFGSLAPARTDGATAVPIAVFGGKKADRLLAVYGMSLTQSAR